MARRTGSCGSGRVVERGPVSRPTCDIKAPTCSARSVRPAESGRLWRYPLLTPRPCNSISTRSAAMSKRAHMPCSSWIGPAAHHRQSQDAEEHHADLPAVACAGTEPGREHLPIPAPELALEPRLRQLRRHHRRRMRGLAEIARRSPSNHFNRDARVGAHRSIPMTLGIKQELCIMIRQPAPGQDPARALLRRHAGAENAPIRERRRYAAPERGPRRPDGSLFPPLVSGFA